MIKKYKLVILILLVILSMLSILKAFGLSQDKQNHPYMPRQMNLSGNIVNFAIPENFSLDFPADDLIEVLNLNDEKLFQDEKPITLLRRWWDFKGDSFFAKDFGSMMMTIHVYEIADKQKNISHPIGFIQSIQSDLEKRDKEENSGASEEFKVIFPSSYDGYVQKKFNRLTWLRNATGTFDEKQITYHYWIQLTNQNYITVEFHFAPNNSISMRSFIDTYCRDMLEKIMSSFDIIYANENTIKLKLEKNSQLDLKKLIEKLN